MRTWYKPIAIFLSAFMFFMHPLALLATEVATSTSPASTSGLNGIPNNFLFTQDMYNGLDSEQVRMLQILLNSDSRTVVKLTGPGSQGNETTYFGNATQNAVERFQIIYKSVILEPLGFSNPTGIIGARSRSVLNQILDNTKNNLPSSTETTSLDITTTTASTTPLSITTASVPSATVETSYSGTIQGIGGNESYNWVVLYGSLPSGITARSGVCVTSPCKAPFTLSGTPKSAGSYTFIVRISSGNQYVTKEFVINVQDRAGSTTQNNTSNNTNNDLFTYNPGTSAASATGTSNSSSSNANIGVAAGIVGAAAISSAIGKSSSSGGVRTVFGGRIVYVQYCTCTAFILLFIYDVDLKSVIQLLYIPGVSRLFQAYNVFQPGPQVLGGYIQSGVPCMVYAGTSCVQVGSPTGIIDFLRGVGTSAQ